MRRLITICAGGGSTLPYKPLEALLRSAPDCKNLEGTRRWFEAARTRMVDSGGYQIYKAEHHNDKRHEAWENGEIPDGIEKVMTFSKQLPMINSERELNISPLHVAHIASELRAHFVIGLDYPVRKVKDKHQQEKEFLQKLGFNVAWAREMSQLRQQYCPDTKLLLPVQCYTLEQFDMFFRPDTGGEL